MKTFLFAAAVLAPFLAVAGCSGGSDQLLGEGDPTVPTSPTTDPTTPPPATLECTVAPQGRTYKGFDGLALEANRINENVGINRTRIKPYSAMSEEYARVLGSVPASLATQGDSFTASPARWFEEPQATGVGLATLYGVGFEGALAYAKSDVKFAQAPTAQSAPVECAAFMTKAWMRTPIPSEIQQCATFATTGLAKETVAQRKWAYVFASVLSATRFITY